MNGESVEKLARMIARGGVVLFGGAGMSTESGIPDFRSKDGLYAQKFAYPPEVMLSHSFFETHTREFFDFYREKILICLSKSPNAAHILCAEWEKRGLLDAVVTQNIDGLHAAAGSKNVFELHGSVMRNYCQKCGKSFSAQFVKNASGVPRCDCGGVVKPDVVLYEEALSEEVMRGAISAVARAKTLIIAGTSLTVYPAAAMPQYFGGENLVLINRDITPLDKKADLVFHEKVGDVFSACARVL